MPVILAHLSRRFIGELIVYQWICRLCVGASVTLSNMDISATSRPNSTKFYLKHHLSGRLIALGFGPGRIGTLDSMATSSSHRVIMGEHVVNTLAPSFFIGPSSYL